MLVRFMLFGQLFLLVVGFAKLGRDGRVEWRQDNEPLNFNNSSTRIDVD
jgi:hypothetical protein